MTDTDYSTEIAAVVAALNAVFENKEANKKDTLSGDYSSDTASYPTCKSVKAAYGTRVTSWSATPSDSNIPSEKLVKDTFDTVSSMKFIEVVDTLPIPSADTMGKLYIISEVESGVSRVNVYYTKQSGSGSSTVYAMVKMDADILDSLVVNWSDIQNKPSFGTGANDFAYGNHTHGEITNSGAVTTTVDMATSGTADKILIADASDSNKVKATSQVLVDQIKNTRTLSHIGGNLDTQDDINSAINTRFGAIPVSTEFVQEVASLPQASDQTLGKVYAIPLSSSAGTYDNYKLYITVEHKGDTKVYQWERIDTDAINEVKVFAGQLATAINAINPSS